ncbi:hypothetical protein TorRG33x02_287050, partial [Trema orientale]
RYRHGTIFSAVVPKLPETWCCAATFPLVWCLDFSGAPFLRLSSDLHHFRCVTTVSN